ncbi:MAG: hypothetical protein E7621_02590 [Ruminococcaceae bacterium]|nr:hypothetical protein [Oscillospiraceae bacterium]
MTLICAGVASGIIGLFFEDDGEMLKYIKVVLSLCLAASIIPAVMGCAAKIKGGERFLKYEDFGVEEFENRYYETVIEDARKKLCVELEDEIFKKTGIKPDSVNIEFCVEQREDEILVDIKNIEVAVYKSCDKKAIEECVYNALGEKPDIVSEKEGGSMD